MKDRQVNRIDRNTIMVNHLTEDVKEKPDPVKGPRHRAVRQLPAWRLSLAGLNRTRRRNPEAPVTQRRGVENGQSPSLARWRRAPPPTSSTRCRISLSSRVCTMPCRPRSARRSAPGQVVQRGDTWPSGPPAVGRPVTNAFAPGAAELARALRPRLRGEVRIDPRVRALYSTDASNYRQLPIAVVTPRDAADVEATLEACSQRGLPVLGGGTSLAGQTCNTAVVLDFSRHMNQIVQIDLHARTATVQPGGVLDDLRDAVAADGLTFGPDPATHNRRTLGGMIGNNSCGTHSLTTGPTADNVDALEVITYDGVRMWVGATDNGELDRLVTGPGRTVQIYTGLVQLRDRNVDLIRQRFPRTPRRVSGYNLDQLLPENHFNLARALVGTEGTCVVVLKAKLRLTPLPPVRRTVVIGFEDAAAAADAVPAVLERKPYGLEGFDDVLMRDVRKLGLHRGVAGLMVYSSKIGLPRPVSASSVPALAAPIWVAATSRGGPSPASIAQPTTAWILCRLPSPHPRHRLEFPNDLPRSLLILTDGDEISAQLFDETFHRVLLVRGRKA